MCEVMPSQYSVVDKKNHQSARSAYGVGQCKQASAEAQFMVPKGPPAKVKSDAYHAVSPVSRPKIVTPPQDSQSPQAFGTG